MSGFRIFGRGGSGGGGGTVNFRKSITAGFAAITRLVSKSQQEAGVAAQQAPAKLLKTQDAGMAVQQSPATLKHAQGVGMAATTVGRLMMLGQAVGFATSTVGRLLMTRETLGAAVQIRASGKSVSPQGAGAGMGSVLSMNQPMQILGGLAVAQPYYLYTGRKYAGTIDTATNWSNSANALGAPDGSNATRTGQTLGSTTAALQTTPVATTNKGELTITAVKARFYAAQSGTGLNNGDLRFGWRIGAGAITTLVNYSGNVNFLATPDEYDLTAEIAGDWAKLADLRLSVISVLDSATGAVTCSVDALEIFIEAELNAPS